MNWLKFEVHGEFWWVRKSKVSRIQIDHNALWVYTDGGVLGVSLDQLDTVKEQLGLE